MECAQSVSVVVVPSEDGLVFECVFGIAVSWTRLDR